jgi:hypothetical protein
MTRLLTLAMAVYGQPKMLEVWFETLRTYSPDMLADMELLIVDDCGSPPATIPDDLVYELPCQIFRVTEDIPWNQPGARNLALEKCRTDLVLFVDPDMVFPAEMMDRMLEAGAKLPEGEIIRFQLQHHGGGSDGKLDGTSPNTWFCHVKDFLHAGGYDEDYAGHKGWSDVQLLDVMTSLYKIHHRADLFAQFYHTSKVSDAAVMTLDRSTVHNRKIRIKRTQAARKARSWAKWSQQPRDRIRFKWEQIL